MAPAESEKAGTACAFDGVSRIYCYGGQKGLDILGSLVYYDITADTWTVTSATPPPQVNVGVAFHDGKFWFYGGAAADGFSNKLLLYDTATGKMSSKGLGPEKLQGSALFVYEGKLWIVAGSQATNVYSDVVYTYDIASGAFMEEGKLPISFAGAGHAFFQGKLFILGGKFGSGDSEPLYEIDPAGLAVQIRKNDAGWLKGPAMTAGAEALYLFGGQDGSGELSDKLWKITF